MMRDFPDSIRSSVIDSVVPLQSQEMANLPKYTLQQFDLLFASCAADLDCNQTYPDLETVFNETIDRLNQSPVEVSVPSEEDKNHTRSIDGSVFQGVVFSSMYDSTLLSGIPAMIYATHNQAYISMQMGLLGEEMTIDDYFPGMALSLRCAEMEPFSDYELIDKRIEQLDARWQSFFTTESLQEICEVWDVNDLGIIEDQAVISDIPTLVISGEYDPITPPEEGTAAAETLSNHYLYVIPASGHGATSDSMLSSPITPGSIPTESDSLGGLNCGQSLRDDFLDNPTEEPDTSCLNELDEPDYLTDIRPRKGWFKLVKNALSPAPVAFWVMLGSSIVGMIFVLLSAPIAWIKRYRQLQENRTPWRGRIARYMLAIVSLLSLFFLISLGSVFMFSTFVEEKIGYLIVGPSSSWDFLFSLPWITLIITIVAVVFTVIGWKEKLGGIVGRIFYTLGTIFTVAYHLILWMLGFFG